MFTVRRYDPETDFETIKAWGLKWGAEYEKDLLPPTGFIVPGYAAHFLYETKSKVCWIENLIRNPDVSSKDADPAIQLLLVTIFKEAKELGYKVAYATTENLAVVERLKHYGVHSDHNQTLLTIKFKQE